MSISMINVSCQEERERERKNFSKVGRKRGERERSTIEQYSHRTLASRRRKEEEHKLSDGYTTRRAKPLAFLLFILFDLTTALVFSLTLQWRDGLFGISLHLFPRKSFRDFILRAKFPCYNY